MPGGGCGDPQEKPLVTWGSGPRSMGLEAAGQPPVTLTPTPNASGLGEEFEGPWPERSPCVAGIIPVIYYSVLLSLGLPVNLLTTVALPVLPPGPGSPPTTTFWHSRPRISSPRWSSCSWASSCRVPRWPDRSPRLRTANILEFAANHASVWIAVLLTVDRYKALCHPLHHRATSSPGQTRQAIAVVLSAALLTGIPFYWWLDVWRDVDLPSVLDEVLKWAHCLIVYFIPCGIFLVTNSAIIFQLRKRGWSGLRPRVGKSTALLLGVTSLFTLLWAPRIFVMLYHLYVAPVHRDWRVHLALDVANMVAMLNRSTSASTASSARLSGPLSNRCSTVCPYPASGGHGWKGLWWTLCC